MPSPPAYVQHYDPASNRWVPDGWFVEHDAIISGGNRVTRPAIDWARDAVGQLPGMGWWSMGDEAGHLSWGRYGVDPPLVAPSGRTSAITFWLPDGTEALWLPTGSV